MCKRSSGESEVTGSCMQWNAMQPDGDCVQSIHSKYCIRAEWPIRPEFIPGFQLTLCALGYSSRLPLFIGCLYTWVKREKMEQKFFSKEKIRRKAWMSWIWTFWSEGRGNLSANISPNFFLVSFKVTVSNSLLHIFVSEKGVSDRTFHRARFHPRLIFRDSLSWPENDIYDSFNFPNHSPIPQPPHRIAGHTPNL